MGGDTILILYDEQNHPTYPIDCDVSDYHITHVYNGLDLLTFDIPVSSAYYQYIGEEIRVENESNRYVIKSIDEPNSSDVGAAATIDCQLDLDDWKSQHYAVFKAETKYLSEVLDQIKPSGWAVSGAGISSIRRTTELELVTNYDVLMSCMDTYEVVFNFDVKKKRLYVIDPTTYTASGEYVMSGLNLRSLGFSGDSTEFATRLYGYGKDGMTIAGVNDGKDYVENHAYSNRVISIGWKDERYTIPENLKAAMEKKLAALSFPVRSYQCSVIDLCKINPDYDYLTFWMYKVVTLIDSRRNTRINHQIVEYVEYPQDPNSNQVTLSSTAPKIESSINKIYNDISDTQDQTLDIMQDAIDNATSLITGAKGGNVVVTITDGKPTEILIMDTDSVDTAQKVWRWNLGGFGYSQNGTAGPYTTAITMDGAIVADFITAGTMSANVIKSGVLKSQNGTLVFDLDNNKLLTNYLNITGYVEFTGNGNKYITLKSDSGDAVFLYFRSGGADIRIGTYKQRDDLFLESAGSVIIRGISSTGTENAPCNLSLFGSLGVSGTVEIQGVNVKSKLDELERRISAIGG